MLKHKSTPGEDLDEVTRIALHLHQEDVQRQADEDAATVRRDEAAREKQARKDAFKQMEVPAEYLDRAEAVLRQKRQEEEAERLQRQQKEEQRRRERQKRKAKNVAQLGSSIKGALIGAIFFGIIGIIPYSIPGIIMLCALLLPMYIMYGGGIKKTGCGEFLIFTFLEFVSLPLGVLLSAFTCEFVTGPTGSIIAAFWFGIVGAMLGMLIGCFTAD